MVLMAVATGILIGAVSTIAVELLTFWWLLRAMARAQRGEQARNASEEMRSAMAEVYRKQRVS